MDDSDDDDDCNISSSYIPLPTRTKSGRNVNKPVAFVPTLPEPAQGVKRRKFTKTPLAAKCRTCHRGTEPGNDRIVFCNVCNTAYHQHCHNPPISDAVVNVRKKGWLCGPCERSKQNVVQGTEGLVAAESLSIDEKRAYFSTLPQHQLVSLLLHATIRHPQLPIFLPNVQGLIPDPATLETHPTAHLAPQRFSQQQRQQPHSVIHPSLTSLHNSNTSTPTGSNPHPTHHLSSNCEMDAAEAQLLSEIRAHKLCTTVDMADNQNEKDGYDTDPPAPYPKPRE